MMDPEEFPLTWEKRHKQLTKKFNSMFEEERELYGDQPTICRNIMEGYEYHWRKEEEHWEVIAVEEEFSVELPHGHIFRFKVDGIITDEWGMWLLEHKSHKTLPDDNYRFIDLQTARYVWALKKLGYPIDGVLWNYIRTKEPSKPKLTQKGVLSKAKLDTDLFTFVQGLKELGIDPREHRDVILALKRHNSFLRRVKTPKPDLISKTLIKEIVTVADAIERGSEPTRSIDRSCVYMCSYMDICMTELYGGDAKQIISSRYRSATTDDYYANPEKEN